MEPLTIIFKQYLSRGLIQGLKLTRISPPLTHLLYADDLMLMGRADANDTLRYKEILEQFTAISGQQVNPDKTRSWFSLPTTPEQRDNILNTLGGSSASDGETYLGLPVSSNINTSANFLINKFEARLAAWKINTLSMAGMLILIKSVLLSLPVYLMATMLLPAKTIQKINTIIRNFFWGKQEGKYLHLCAWKKITKPHCEGGLAIRDIKTFNQALMLKLAWKLMEQADKPWVQQLQSKYFPRRNQWLAKNYGPSSSTWTAICKLKPILHSAATWIIGNGEVCPAVEEPWFQGWQEFTPTTAAQRRLKVSDLVDRQTLTWNMPALTNLFNLQATLHIIENPSLKPTAMDIPDRLIWKHTTQGTFSTKSAYKHLLQLNSGTSPPTPNQYLFIWKAKLLQPRIALFLWRLCMGNLPTSKRLAQRITSIQPTCRRCHLEDEDDGHCLLTCDIARATWFASELCIKTDNITDPIPDFICKLNQDLSVPQFAYAASLLWALWEQRNHCIFNSKTSSPAAILKRTRESIISSSDLAATDNPTTSTNSPVQIEPHIPIPPPNSLIIHADASWNLDRGGWGYTIHCNSCLIQFACGNTPSPSPLHAEATALLKATEAIQLIQERNMHTQVYLFSDCKGLVDALTSGNPHADWRATRVIAEILELCKNIHNPSYHHVPREQNKEAHNLAAVGRTITEDTIGHQYPTFKPP